MSSNNTAKQPRPNQSQSVRNLTQIRPQTATLQNLLMMSSATPKAHGVYNMNNSQNSYNIHNNTHSTAFNAPMTIQQKNLREKYPQVTSLSPRSRETLKGTEDHRSMFSELNQQSNSNTAAALNSAGVNPLSQSVNHSSTGAGLLSKMKRGSLASAIPSSTKAAQQLSLNTPHNIRITNELAEYAYEDLIEKEVKISQEEYEEFQRKYHRMVFDKNGNYLYTKLEPKSLEQQRTIQEIYASKNTSAQLKKDLNQRHKNFQPEKIIGNLVKSSLEQATMHPRRKAIQDIKARSLKTLNEMLTLSVKEKIIEAAQNEVTKSCGEMTSEVEKVLRENEILRRDLEKLKDLIVELQTQNENASWKNSCLTKDIESINNDFDKLKRNSSELEGFVPQYKRLNAKFPQLDANQLIANFEKLENLCLEFKEKITDLEISQNSSEKQKQAIKSNFDKQVEELKRKDVSRDKELKMYLERLKEKEIEIKDAEEYRSNYMLLQKKVQKIYIDWSDKIKVYPLNSKDTGPRALIQDPLEILDIMEREINISTSQKLQEYLRKIIVSANLLQRKYLPEHVNDKFDPDEIFNRVRNLIDKLTADNAKLKSKVKPSESTMLDTDKTNRDLYTDTQYNSHHFNYNINNPNNPNNPTNNTKNDGSYINNSLTRIIPLDQ